MAPIFSSPMGGWQCCTPWDYQCEPLILSWHGGKGKTNQKLSATMMTPDYPSMPRLGVHTGSLRECNTASRPLVKKKSKPSQQDA